MKKLQDIKTDLVSLSITNIFYCLVIDTYKATDVWTKIFGHGTLSKISSVEIVFSINDLLFFENVQEIITTFVCENDSRNTENNLIRINNDLKCVDFSEYELMKTKTILSSW